MKCLKESFSSPVPSETHRSSISFRVKKWFLDAAEEKLGMLLYGLCSHPLDHSDHLRLMSSLNSVKGQTTGLLMNLNMEEGCFEVQI
ncbi:hypothetical protein ROHU_016233 [Labeo rohita]|uniref:Uncharacterized protein n=1 Tax=Labeo rohita TaxID=84645 RepID=A0A498NKE8_LABRO|nr:hypothetical protein ROHU_016233 [Labeo rohita]